MSSTMKRTGVATDGPAPTVEPGGMDYPALYWAADSASLDGQLRYRRLFLLDLALLIVAAATSALGSTIGLQSSSQVPAAAAVVLLGAVVVQLVRWQRRDDRVWFDGRAVAESVKTQAWLYAMRAEPFADDATADREFILRLTATRRARSDLILHLSADAELITDQMRGMRRLALAERHRVYVRQRLREQAEWYQNKAARNEVLSERWYWASLAAQCLALTIAVAGAFLTFDNIDVVGILATMAAAFAAWSEMNRHEELSRSYSAVAQDLVAIIGLADGITTEEEVGNLVREAEGLFSREHTIWVARRSTPLPPEVPEAVDSRRNGAGAAPPDDRAEAPGSKP